MAKEIERKFLVTHDGWKAHVIGKGLEIHQGYLAADDTQQVRVRTKGEKAFIALKRATGEHLTRDEYEYEIPVQDARSILKDFRTNSLEKTRYNVRGPDGKIWEVDVYKGKLAGLVAAEIELKYAEETFQKPHWVGAELSGDKRFSNRHLATAEAAPSIAGLARA